MTAVLVKFILPDGMSGADLLDLLRESMGESIAIRCNGNAGEYAKLCLRDLLGPLTPGMLERKTKSIQIHFERLDHFRRKEHGAMRVVRYRQTRPDEVRHQNGLLADQQWNDAIDLLSKEE